MKANYIGKNDGTISEVRKSYCKKAGMIGKVRKSYCKKMIFDTDIIK